MIIILEGPRGTGKTALSKALVRRLIEARYSPTIAKFERGTNPTEDMIASLEGFQTDTLRDPRRAVIIDRFHLTEYVMRSADHTVSAGKLLADMVRISYLLQNMGAWVTMLHCNEEERQRRVWDRADGRSDEPPAVVGLWEHARTVLSDRDNKFVFNNMFFVDTTKRDTEMVAKMQMVRIGLRAEMLARKGK